MSEELKSSFSRGGSFEPRISYDVKTSDVRSLVRGELRELRERLEKAAGKARNAETEYHYRDVIARINKLLGEEED